MEAEESDHSSYLEFADYLRTRHGESARSFDKTLATLSSGALAISVGTVDDWTRLRHQIVHRGELIRLRRQDATVIIG